VVATLSRGVTDVHKLPLTAHTSRPCLACISWCTVKWSRSTGDLSTVARSSYTSLFCLEIAVYNPLDDICETATSVEPLILLLGTIARKWPLSRNLCHGFWELP